MRYATVYFTIFLFIVACSCSRKTLQTVADSRTAMITADTMLVNRMLSSFMERVMERQTRQSINTSAVTLINDCTVIVKDTEGNIVDYFHSRGKTTDNSSDRSNESMSREGEVKAVGDTAAVVSIHKETGEETKVLSEIKVAERPLSLWERVKDAMVWVVGVVCIVVVLYVIWLIHRKV